MNHLKIITIFFGLCLLLNTTTYTQNCTFDDPQKQREYEVLLEIYDINGIFFQRYVGEEWQQLANGEICSLCGTERVVCNADGYVTGLYFLYVGSEHLDFGQLPESIEQLTYLRALDISNNIGFSFFPNNIGNLPNLEYLRADYCNIYLLPESIGRLNNLKYFGVVHNEIKKLPDSIVYLSNLEELYVDENKLTTLPENFGNLSSLEVFNFNRNNIHALPSSIKNLDSLRVGRFWENNISCIPVELVALCNRVSPTSYVIGLTDNPIDIIFPEFCNNPEVYACPYDTTLMPCYDDIYRNNSTISYGHGVIGINTVFTFFVEPFIPYGVEPAGKVEVIRLTNGMSETMLLCDGNCEQVEIIDNLPTGDYLVKIYEPDGTFFCELATPIHLMSADETTGEANCDAVTITPSNNQITISGLTATYNKVELLGAGTNWQNLTICDGDCPSTQVISEISSGTYTVKVQQRGADGGYCYTDAIIEVGGETIEPETTCDALTFSTGSGQITVSGLTALDNKIEIIGANTGWQNQTICDGNCSETQVINNLTAGEYEVKVQQWDENDHYCYRAETVVTEALQGEGDENRLRQAIHLTGFTKEKQVQLQWIATSPKTTDYYLVERAAEGEDFQAVALLPKSDQSWMDSQPVSGTSQYRIRQVFVNGSFQYSGEETITYDWQEQTIGLFPNPAQKELFVNMPQLQGKQVTIQLYHIFGGLIKTYPVVQVEKTMLRLDLTDLDNGLYCLSVQAEKGQLRSQRFVVENGK